MGTKGQLHVNPAYEYAEGLAYELTVKQALYESAETGNVVQVPHFRPRCGLVASSALRDLNPQTRSHQRRECKHLSPVE